MLPLMPRFSENLWGLCYQFFITSLSTNTQRIKQSDLNASVKITAVSRRPTNEKQPLIL